MARSRRSSRSVLSALLLAAVVLLSSHRAGALERVTLRNGFSYDCAQQQTLDATHVRLVLFEPTSADASNYIDLPLSAIDRVDPLPDPPRSAPAAASLDRIPAPSDVHSLLAHAGVAHDIDVELLASIVDAESSGRATAVSHAGAQGLMQLMPSTAHSLGVADPLRPEDNIAGGTAYLDSLLTRYKDNLALALAAYNAGPDAVDRFHGIPPYRETQAYVVRVMTEFKRRKQLLAHAMPPAPVNTASAR